MAAIAQDDVWAVGDQSPSLGSSYPLLEHWDGRSWQLLPDVQNVVSGSSLLGIEAISADDVWAVGEEGSPNGSPLVVHWDGHSWQIGGNVGIRFGALAAVAGASSGDVWAVGYTGGTTAIVHWDGSRWASVAHPRISEGGLGGLAVMGSSEIWAAGGNDWGLATVTACQVARSGVRSCKTEGDLGETRSSPLLRRPGHAGSSGCDDRMGNHDDEPRRVRQAPGTLTYVRNDCELWVMDADGRTKGRIVSSSSRTLRLLGIYQDRPELLQLARTRAQSMHVRTRTQRTGRTRKHFTCIDRAAS